MYSLLNRGGYHNKLIYPRFFQLSMNYIMSIIIYFVVHCILQQQIHIQDFLRGLHDFHALGNPTWFILMTLLTYILTYICFKIQGKKHPVITIAALTMLLIVTMHIVTLVKPLHWVNTLLCFPAGMLYFLKGEQIEQALKKTNIPGIIYASLLLLLGMIIYMSGISPIVYVQNLGSILFAIGVTWFAGSFTWREPSHFLIWLGGSGLFAVYIFHLLPMRIMTHLELNHANPYLV